MVEAKVYRAEPVTDVVAGLAESVRWHAERERVLWVDITAGRLFQGILAPGGAVRLAEVTDIGEPLGACAPASGGGWLLAAGHRFAHLDAEGHVRELAMPQRTPDPSGAWRMNDAACDAMGRVFASAIAQPPRPGTSLLYRYEAGGRVEVAVDGMTIGNGIGWSPDSTSLYLNDSGEATLSAFDYDLGTGALSGRRVVFTGDERLGKPDGLTVDDEGMIWIAAHGAGAARRLTPEGREVARVEVPASQVTSCWLGGRRRRTLFITAAREGFTAADSAREPLAGRLFAAEVDVPGPGGRPFAM